MAKYIRFFDEQKERTRYNEQLWQYMIIGFSSLIPIISVIELEKLFSNIALAILGRVVSATTVILQSEKNHERWLDANRTDTNYRNI